jgi:hypothetical protein
MNNEPIAEFKLPHAHPAVANTSPGDFVHIKAKRVAEPPMPPGMESKGPKAPPLEARFHAMSIAAAKKAAADTDEDEGAEEETPSPKKGKTSSPVETVRRKRAAQTAQAGY